jgi:uncharacterized protein DUF6220
MSTTTVPRAGYRATTTQVMRYLAMAGGTLAMVQFALAGFGAFRSLDGDQKGFGAHQAVGYIVALLSLLALVAALIARPNQRTIILAIVLFVVAGPIQPMLPDLAKDHGAWIGALHGLLGIAILGLFGQLSRKVAVTQG